MGTVAAIGAVGGGMALGSIGNIVGANAQTRALKRGQNIQRDYQNQLLEFQRMIYGDASPYRDLATGLLPDLEASVRNPQTSEGFKIASQEGLDLLRSNAAVSGDPNSGSSQIAQGRFLSGLTASERDRQISDMFRLAGFGQGASSQAAGQSAQLLGAAGGPAANMSNMAIQQGAVTGGLYGSLGKDISQLGLLYGLGAFNNGGMLGGGP